MTALQLHDELAFLLLTAWAPERGPAMDELCEEIFDDCQSAGFVAYMCAAAVLKGRKHFFDSVAEFAPDLLEKIGG